MVFSRVSNHTAAAEEAATTAAGTTRSAVSGLGNTTVNYAVVMDPQMAASNCTGGSNLARRNVELGESRARGGRR